MEDGRISTSLVQPQSAATKAVPRGQCMETLPEGAIWINFFSSVRSAKLVQTESKSKFMCNLITLPNHKKLYQLVYGNQFIRIWSKYWWNIMYMECLWDKDEKNFEHKNLSKVCQYFVTDTSWNPRLYYLNKISIYVYRYGS